VLRTDEEKIEASKTPSVMKALEALSALQEEAKHISDEFLGHIWIMREVDPGFKALTDLDEKGRLPYAGPCGGNSLADIEKAYLPDHFLNADDYAPGRSAFYATVFAQKIEAQMATLDAMDAEQKKTIWDLTFIDAARAVAEELVKEYLCVGTRYAGHSDRNALVRLLEKIKSMQLFGRHARAAVGVIASGCRAGVDADVLREFLSALAADSALDPMLDVDGDNTLSYGELCEAVKPSMAIFNKIIATKRVFRAVSRIVGDAYLALGRGLSAMEEDFEAFIAAATGSMIERGGTNVALLGCLPKKDPRRCEGVPLSRAAFRLMRDDAFSEMEPSGYGLDEFEKAYEKVKGRLAREVFADDDELLRRLAAVDALVRKHGVQVLAAADAEAHEGKENVAPLTYNDMHAGTFARALSAMAGQKGAEKRAEMFAEYFSGNASQKVIRAVETWLNGMGWRTPEEHRALSMGGRTPEEHRALSMGGRTPEEHRALSMGGRTPEEHRALVLAGRTPEEHNVLSALGRKRKAREEHRAMGGRTPEEHGVLVALGKRKAAAEPGARRVTRFTSGKGDPPRVLGAVAFIALGVPLICVECHTKETGQWYSSKADPDKAVCQSCFYRQVCRASHSLASIVCILSALPVFVTDASVMFLHSSAPPAATAPNAGSPVRTRRQMYKSRVTAGAWLCSEVLATKKRPPTASAPRARRAWTR
jgi:hypothetical protein